MRFHFGVQKSFLSSVYHFSVLTFVQGNLISKAQTMNIALNLLLALPVGMAFGYASQRGKL